MGSPQRIVCKDGVTQVVCVPLMKGGGGLHEMSLISDSALKLLGSGLSVRICDCDISVVLSDEPEDIGWELYKEQHNINSLLCLTDGVTPLILSKPTSS